MKIIIIHGEHTSASYERLLKYVDLAKSKDYEIHYIQKDQNIKEELISQSLFAKKRILVIEDGNLINKSTIEFINKNIDRIESSIIIYHQGNFNKTLLRKLPDNTKVEEFKLPKLIWSMIDSFYPGNGRNFTLLLHKIVEKEPIEFIFALLAKQLRDLYWIKVYPKQIDIPSWRSYKLKKQSSRFNLNQLKNIISYFAEIDIKSKTSKVNLLDALDFLVAENLE